MKSIKQSKGKKRWRQSYFGSFIMFLLIVEASIRHFFFSKIKSEVGSEYFS